MRPVAPFPGSILSRRLAGAGGLRTDDLARADQLADGLVRIAQAKRDVIREGDTAHAAFLVTSGWACRYKTLPDGRRQIVAFLVPGDLCDINGHVLGTMDHSIGALTTVQYVEIGHEALSAASAERPQLARALWWQMMVGVSVQREWTLNTGQRSALERIGHLFCEMFHRLSAVGMTDPSSYPFPLTQNDLAEATGLTPVHVNRTLQEMRATGLIVLKERVLEIPDMERLEDAVLFSPDYLHQEGIDIRRAVARPIP